jgi:ergothioneine biosynthesis protein EgtB
MSDTINIPSYIGGHSYRRPDTDERRRLLIARYVRIRAVTKALAAGLTPEDCMLQSMPDASPVKWHLAHTTWFFEVFVLERADPEYIPFDQQYRYLFNSYYNAIGEQYPRPRRGLLSRPSLAEINSYRRSIDEQILCGISERRWPDTLLDAIELGLHHEQQHQELILTDIKHHFWNNPSLPAYRPLPAPPPRPAPALQWLAFEGGRATIGAPASGFSYDNERPQHEVLATPFELASRLVTNGEYAEFIEDGGYERPELWLSDGWALRQRKRWKAPLYWLQDFSGKSGRSFTARKVFTLGGIRSLNADEPVCHISYFEADAYARWRNYRLPTESEWEYVAARSDRAGSGAFLEDGLLHPRVAKATESDLAQMLGDAWEWTCSAYLPYPGFSTSTDNALGEYNGKFMINQMVLRGGSCATSHDHVRPSYRNFFSPHSRWQFSGIRLAR